VTEHKNPDFWKIRYEQLTQLIAEAEVAEDTNKAIKLTSRRDEIIEKLTPDQRQELGIS